MDELHAGCVMRAMVHADLPAVCAIENATQPTPWSEQVFRDCLSSQYDCSVVERDAQLVAFQVVSHVLDEAHLLNIAVAPAMQRRGIAWAMLQRLHQQCQAQGASVIYLEVRDSNVGAQALYRHLGYIETGRRKAYYRTQGGREDAVLMMLMLQPHK